MEMRYDRNKLGPLMEESEQFLDYLEVADFIMRETVSSSSGMWLKGSLTCYQERAI
jgi:hypothetical protein